MRFIFLLLFISCSTNAQFLDPIVDNELQPYLEDFEILIGENKHKHKLKKVTMVFADLNKGLKPKDKKRTLGQCEGMFEETTKIEIDIEYWKDATQLSKQFTVFHELGHCICTQGHTEIREGFWNGMLDRIKFALGMGVRKGYMQDACPASLMHPYEFDYFCMLRNFDYYMADLKKSCK
jgi:hypothetical protein